MPDISSSVEALLLTEDLQHQQLRVLILIGLVSGVPGTGSKLDGLTKLAKLDFIARYPDLEPSVAKALPGAIPDMTVTTERLLTATPMIRYRYGPWDDRYHTVIGALVGRGLVRYTRGKRGSVAMSLTAQGGKLMGRLDNDPLWRPVTSRYRTVASRYALFSGNQLKEAIYDALPELLDMPLGRELT